MSHLSPHKHSSKVYQVFATHQFSGKERTFARERENQGEANPISGTEGFACLFWLTVFVYRWTPGSTLPPECQVLSLEDGPVVWFCALAMASCSAWRGHFIRQRGCPALLPVGLHSSQLTGPSMAPCKVLGGLHGPRPSPGGTRVLQAGACFAPARRQEIRLHLASPGTAPCLGTRVSEVASSAPAASRSRSAAPRRNAI